MTARNFAQPQVTLYLRSCFRCGAEFRTLHERMRVCETCRRPRLSQPLVEPGQKLTPRERQVIDLVAQGMSNKVIASELHLSEGTIKAYLFRIFLKTKVGNRTELAVWQVRGGSPELDTSA